MTDPSTGGSTPPAPTGAPRRRARALALVAAALIAVAIAIVWLTVDTRQPGVTAAFYSSFILLPTAPLLFAARRLGRDDDAVGPLVAGTVSVLILAVPILYSVWVLAHTPAADRGWFPILVIGLLIAQGRGSAVALAASIVLVALAVTAFGIWRATANRRLRVGIDGLATIGVMFAAATGMRTRPLTVTPTGAYQFTTAQYELRHAYTCLWSAAGPGAIIGFPATLGECEWPDAAPGSAAYGSGYILQYHPTRRANDGRALGFSLVTIDAGHRNPESFYLDETGTVRRATGARATATSPVWVTEACADVQSLVRAADSSGGSFLGTMYTKRTDSLITLGDGSTETHYQMSGRGLIYRRLGNRYTLSLFTRDSLPRHDATMMADPRLDLLRNFFLDSAGVTHVTGELRPATTADPAVTLTRCE